MQNPVNNRGLVDLVERDFFPDAANEVWYGDVTYTWTLAGWAYLATVIDGFSRQVIGWAVADHMPDVPVLRYFRNPVGTGEGLMTAGLVSGQFLIYGWIKPIL